MPGPAVRAAGVNAPDVTTAMSRLLVKSHRAGRQADGKGKHRSARDHSLSHQISSASLAGFNNCHHETEIGAGVQRAMAVIPCAAVRLSKCHHATSTSPRPQSFGGRFQLPLNKN
jgi:hypothetical protein